MGNRCYITNKDKKLAIYLHWNGGKDSINAFLAYCEMRDFRNDYYGMARLCQIIANYIGKSLSIGISEYIQDNGKFADNGIYVIDNWRIIDRIHVSRKEQQEYDLLEMIIAINEKQPKEQQLSEIEITEKFQNILVG